MAWERNPEQEQLTRFVAGLTNCRHNHPVFRRFEFFRGAPVRGATMADVKWLNSSGHKMTDEEWNGDSTHCLGIFLSGHLDGENGEEVKDDFFLICLNAWHEPVDFFLPAGLATDWELVLDTNDEKGFVKKKPGTKGKLVRSERSLCVLRTKQIRNLQRNELRNQ